MRVMAIAVTPNMGAWGHGGCQFKRGFKGHSHVSFHFYISLDYVLAVSSGEPWTPGLHSPLDTIHRTVKRSGDEMGVKIIAGPLGT